MSWFWFALAAPAFFSLSNLIDRYLLVRGANADAHESKEKSFTALILYTSFLGILAPIAMLLFGVQPFQGISTINIGIVMLNGLVSVASLYFYLKALERGDASVVVPLFQLLPVFTLLFGYVFLQETLTHLQVIGFIVTLAGSFLISVELEGTGARKVKVKSAILLLMLAANITAALNGIIYKAIVNDSPFLQTMLWEYVGAFIFGIVIVIVSHRYRAEAIRIITARHWKMIGVNSTNELIYITGLFFFRFAAIAVPVALVNVVNGFQPVFILLFGWLFTRFVPGFVTEDISRRNMIQKSIAIVVIVIGGVLINMNGIL